MTVFLTSFWCFTSGTEEGKRHEHCTASTVFRSAECHPPGQPHFLTDQMSHLEMLSRKMPEVSTAGSKCSFLFEVHSERRKDGGDRAVQRTELQKGAKREEKERGTMTKNVCIMVSCHTVSMVTSLCTTFMPYSHPFGTDSQGVTSDQCPPS